MLWLQMGGFPWPGLVAVVEALGSMETANLTVGVVAPQALIPVAHSRRRYSHPEGFEAEVGGSTIPCTI